MLLPLAILLHLPAFFREYEGSHLQTGFLSDNIEAWQAEQPILSHLLVAFIIFFNAILINRMVIINRMAVRISLYPGALYIVLASMLPPFLDVTIIPLVNTFYIIMIGQLFYLHVKYEIMDKLFNIGLYCGMMALVYPPAIFYLLLCYIALLILRRIRMKENLNMLNAFLVPFYLFAAYFIWKDMGRDLITMMFGDSFGFLNVPKTWTNMSIVSMVLLFFLPVLSFVNYRTYVIKKSIQVRKKIDILFWSMLLTGIFLVFHAEWHVQYGLFLLPALAFLLSENLQQIKNPVLVELIYLGFIVFGVMSNFVL